MQLYHPEHDHKLLESIGLGHGDPVPGGIGLGHGDPAPGGIGLGHGDPPGD